MNRGQQTLLDNWLLEAVDELTLAADIRILMFLGRHARYRTSEYSTKQLAIALELDARTVQAATARLYASGLILSAGGVHCVYKAPARLVQTTCKKTRVEDEKTPSQREENDALKYRSDEVRKKGTDKQQRDAATVGEEDASLTLGGTLRAPVVEADSEEFDDPEFEALLGEAQGLPQEATALTITGQVNLPEGGEKTEPTEGEEVPAAPAALVDKPVDKSQRKPTRTPVKAESTSFQLVFEQIARACYGGTDDLTTEAKGRIGKAARSLAEANYKPDDVPAIVAWIRANESWRTGTLAPQTIAERAPAWKAGARGNLPLTHEAATPATSEARQRYEERYA